MEITEVKDTKEKLEGEIVLVTKKEVEVTVAPDGKTLRRDERGKK